MAHARLNHFGDRAWVHHEIGLKTTSKSVYNHQYINIMPLKKNPWKIEEESV